MARAGGLHVYFARPSSFTNGQPDRNMVPTSHLFLGVHVSPFFKTDYNQTEKHQLFIEVVDRISDGKNLKIGFPNVKRAELYRHHTEEDEGKRVQRFKQNK